MGWEGGKERREASFLLGFWWSLDGGRGERVRGRGMGGR